MKQRIPRKLKKRIHKKVVPTKRRFLKMSPEQQFHLIRNTPVGNLIADHRKQHLITHLDQLFPSGYVKFITLLK